MVIRDASAFHLETREIPANRSALSLGQEFWIQYPTPPTRSNMWVRKIQFRCRVSNTSAGGTGSSITVQDLFSNLVQRTEVWLNKSMVWEDSTSGDRPHLAMWLEKVRQKSRSSSEFVSRLMDESGEIVNFKDNQTWGKTLGPGQSQEFSFDLAYNFDWLDHLPMDRITDLELRVRLRSNASGDLFNHCHFVEGTAGAVQSWVSIENPRLRVVYEHYINPVANPSGAQPYTIVAPRYEMLDVTNRLAATGASTFTINLRDDFSHLKRIVWGHLFLRPIVGANADRRQWQGSQGDITRIRFLIDRDEKAVWGGPQDYGNLGVRRYQSDVLERHTGHRIYFARYQDGVANSTFPAAYLDDPFPTRFDFSFLGRGTYSHSTHRLVTIVTGITNKDTHLYELEFQTANGRDTYEAIFVLESQRIIEVASDGTIATSE